MQGDYYYNAMMQAYYGDTDQAQELGQKGDLLNKEIGKYTGGWLGAAAEKVSGIPLIGNAINRILSGDYVALIGLLMFLLGLIGALREVFSNRRTNAKNTAIFLVLALVGILLLIGKIPGLS